MFFDMLEVLPFPIACPNGTNTSVPKNRGPNPCTNPEAGGPELMVNKLTLEVDTRYSGCESPPISLSLPTWAQGLPVRFRRRPALTVRPARRRGV